MDNSSVPFGYCHCGCGQKTVIAKASQSRSGRVKGQPARYVLGHTMRGAFKDRAEEQAKYKREWERDYPSVPYGECVCGCGQKTNLSYQTDTRLGLVGGAPRRFVWGHQAAFSADQKHKRAEEYRAQWERQRPDIPYGHCWCGCGEKTRPANMTHPRNGYVTGEPVRYVRGHHTRKVPAWEHYGRFSREEVKAIRAKQQAERRGLLLTAGGAHSAEDILQMVEDQGRLCAYCEEPLDASYHVDHMTPLVRGGSNDWSNLAISCQPCNSRKHAKTAEEFMSGSP